MDKTIGELFKDIFVGWGSFIVLMLRVALFFLKIPFKIWKALGLGNIGTTANCRKRRSIDLRFLRYEGLTAVA